MRVVNIAAVTATIENTMPLVLNVNSREIQEIKTATARNGLFN
jgi:hypothetical protein